MRQEIEGVDRKKTETFSHRKVTQLIRFRATLEEFSFYFASELLFAPLFEEAKAKKEAINLK